MPDSPWYRDGLRFECTQCGNCCTGPSGYVWFTDAEGEAIATRLGLSDAEFRRRFAKRSWGRWTLGEVKNGRGEYDCVFLRRDAAGKALCSIYEDRPKQCRTWPFWPENLENPAAWIDAAQRCPGMADGLRGGGRFYPVEQVGIVLRHQEEDA